MIDRAIEKINAEMQKNPSDPYTEIVGHYVIDRCADEAVAAKVMDKKKTLKGALEAVTAKARKAQKGNVAVLLPADVFGEVDGYFGLSTDPRAQLAAMGTAPGAPPVMTAPPEQPPKADIDLLSFF